MAHRVFGIFACVVFLMWTSNLKGLHKCLAWVGKYTLELYILHMLIMATLQQSTISSEFKTVITIGGAFVLCVPVNKVCHMINNRLLS